MRQRTLNITTLLTGAFLIAASLGTAAWRSVFRRVESERAVIETVTDRSPGGR